MPAWQTFRRRSIASSAVVAVVFAGLIASGTASQAAAQGLCDIYAAGGTPCVAAQESFCANTSCVIAVSYDESGKGNHLTRALRGHSPGPAADGNDNLANAFEAPVTVGGHKVYGGYVAPGTGYLAGNGGASGRDSTVSWAQDTSWLTATPWS
ncbi:arabinofuranosidase catalytic domain-containing protein [Amycolatopsis kentuckyensis]|uniref:arabinofuranosidase catalytic domain-containing protein n=1 Tax=Amycolatopsis kentuckyensis TaxID=218823 RepID=UPI003566394D